MLKSKTANCIHGRNFLIFSTWVLAWLSIWLLIGAQEIIATETYEYVSEWGSFGPIDGEFNFPLSIAINKSSGIIYVADALNERIQMFNLSGAFLGKWGTFGTGDRQFQEPQGIGVSTSGFVIVSDTNNDRIQKFSSTGTFELKWGSFDHGTLEGGKFHDPTGVAIDSNEDIYIVDSGNNGIQKFDLNGNFDLRWGNSQGNSGTINGEFRAPWDVAVDGANKVYVTDYLNNRIQKFSSEGTYEIQWGSFGSGNGQFNFPVGIATDYNGNIYVTEGDGDNTRIQIFSSTGGYKGQFGSEGSGPGQFSFPYDVAVDAQGYIYVVDAGNNRIQKFRKVSSSDPVSPNDIQDLSISSVTSDSITIQWTAPGDDGSIGAAAYYDIRYRTGAAITNGNFDSSTIWNSSRAVTVSGGTHDSETIAGLLPGSTYFFAIKSRDEIPNVSNTSNSTGVFLGSDSIPPSAITDLTVIDQSSSSVKLQWTAAGDDGTIGAPASYDIRYRVGEVIAESNFDSSNSMIKVATDISGSLATIVVTGLSQGEEYFFAIKTRDDELNVSSISNSPRVRTLMAVPYFNQTVLPWSNQRYDHMAPSEIVEDWGCMMTNMAMIINYYADFHPFGLNITKTDPKELNEWLISRPGSLGYGRTGNALGSTRLGAIGPKTNNAVLKLKSNSKGQGNELLNAEISKKRPVILHVEYTVVKTNGQIKKHDHYVVAIGSTAIGVIIHDPAHSNVKTLTDPFTVPNSTGIYTYSNNYIDIRRFDPWDGSLIEGTLNVSVYEKD